MLGVGLGCGMDARQRPARTGVDAIRLSHRASRPRIQLGAVVRNVHWQCRWPVSIFSGTRNSEHLRCPSLSRVKPKPTSLRRPSVSHSSPFTCQVESMDNSVACAGAGGCGWETCVCLCCSAVMWLWRGMCFCLRFRTVWWCFRPTCTLCVTFNRLMSPSSCSCSC